MMGWDGATYNRPRGGGKFEFSQWAPGWKPGQGTTCVYLATGMSKCQAKFPNKKTQPSFCWFSAASRKQKPCTFTPPADSFIELGATDKLSSFKDKFGPLATILQSHCGGSAVEHIQLLLSRKKGPGKNEETWMVVHGGQNCGGKDAECIKVSKEMVVNMETNDIKGSSMSGAVRNQVCCLKGKTSGVCAPGVPRKVKTIVHFDKIGQL